MDEKVFLSVRKASREKCEVVVYDGRSGKHSVVVLPQKEFQSQARCEEARFLISRGLWMGSSLSGAPVGNVRVTLFTESKSGGNTNYVLCARYEYDVARMVFRRAGGLCIYALPGWHCFDPVDHREILEKMLGAGLGVEVHAAGSAAWVRAHPSFRACLYLHFGPSTSVFLRGALGVYDIGRMKPLGGGFGCLRSAAGAGSGFGFSVAELAEAERMLLENFPAYHMASRETHFPMDKFIGGVPIHRAIEYKLFAKCAELGAEIPVNRAGKRVVKLQKHIESYMLSGEPDGSYFPPGSCYVHGGSLCIRGKTFREVDLFSCYPSSFMDLYEAGKFREFRPLYKCVTDLVRAREECAGRACLRSACKKMLNAGCYGYWNSSSSAFGQHPDLMVEIVRSVQAVMRRSRELLEGMGYLVVFSKVDSHFVARRTSEEVSDEAFAGDVRRVNARLAKAWRHARFVHKGTYAHGAWVDQNSYILQAGAVFDPARDKARGRLFRGKSTPGALRRFAMLVAQKLFSGARAVSLPSEYESYCARRQGLSGADMLFERDGEARAYVSGSGAPTEMGLREMLRSSPPVAVESGHTMEKFRRYTVRRLARLPLVSQD